MRWLKWLIPDQSEEWPIVHIECTKIQSEKREAFDEAHIAQLASSIDNLGLLYPLILTGHDPEYRLIAGRNRFEACKRIGYDKVPCIVVEGSDEALELVQIDENWARKELGPSDRALLLLRRENLLKILVAQATDGEPQSSTSHNRKIGSIRDLAERTGDRKDNIHRTLRRGKKLGPDILQRTRGTSLDTASELDALAALPDDAKEWLVARAEAGETVSARTSTGRPTKRKPAGHPAPREKALITFHKWRHDNPCVDEIDGLRQPISRIAEVLSNQEREGSRQT